MRNTHNVILTQGVRVLNKRWMDFVPLFIVTLSFCIAHFVVMFNALQITPWLLGINVFLPIFVWCLIFYAYIIYGTYHVRCNSFREYCAHIAHMFSGKNTGKNNWEGLSWAVSVLGKFIGYTYVFRSMFWTMRSVYVFYVWGANPFLSYRADTAVQRFMDLFPGAWHGFNAFFMLALIMAFFPLCVYQEYKTSRLLAKFEERTGKDEEQT